MLYFSIMIMHELNIESIEISTVPNQINGEVNDCPGYHYIEAPLPGFFHDYLPVTCIQTMTKTRMHGDYYYSTLFGRAFATITRETMKMVDIFELSSQLGIRIPVLSMSQSYQTS